MVALGGFALKVGGFGSFDSFRGVLRFSMYLEIEKDTLYGLYIFFIDVPMFKVISKTM